MTNHPPAGTVTFLFTDIEGSTLLWEKQPEAMKVALARHDMLLRRIFDFHHGHIFKTMGDAFYAAFESPQDAVSAAVESQEALQKESWGEAVIKVRMALHCGEVETRDNDYFGQPLNRVARLLSAGHGGQVLISTAIKERVAASLPANTSLHDMGERRLTDLIRPEHIFQPVIPNLQNDFPPLRTLDAFRTNLPARLTSFIGREKEIAEVKKLVSQNRMVTLTGVGGTGKTRLSLQVASTVLDDFPGGVWFIELAPINNPDLILQTITATLQLQELAGRSPQEILTAYLQARSVLLVLDNCEHLLHACAQLATHLLQYCPKLKVIATTREPLGISGEMIWSVPSFSIPQTDGVLAPDILEQFDSVRLFVERARAVQRGFDLNESNARTVVQICNRLDGIPLALELAAARVRGLSVDQIAARLDSRFRLLTGGSRSALPRQQTLSALIDWSYNLLSETERLLFMRLAVFTGSFTLAAAEQVGSGDGIHEIDVLDLVQRLVDKSLVLMEEHHGETYYRLLETIRQYGRDKLFSSDQLETLTNRHLDYYLKLTEEAEHALRGSRQIEWFRRLGVMRDNLRTAFEWVIENGQTLKALRFATGLDWFWFMRADHTEARQWLNRILAMPDALQFPNLKSKAMAQLALQTWLQVSAQQAKPIADEALLLAQAHEDRWHIAYAQTVLSLIKQDLGHTEKALHDALESAASFKELGDEWNYAHSMFAHAREQAQVEETYRAFVKLGDLFLQSPPLMTLSYSQILNNDITSALLNLKRAIHIAQQFENQMSFALILVNFADAAKQQGEHERAISLYLSSKNIFDRIGAWGSNMDRNDALLEQWLAPCRTVLDVNAFEAAAERGRVMTLEQAVQFALEN